MNADSGWAVGIDWDESGAILKTTDGGTTWNYQKSSLPNYLRSIHFINADTGWVVGELKYGKGVILKTCDGGITWITQLNLSEVLYSAYFLDKNNGWAAGKNGTILKTIDGGTNWIPQKNITANNLYSVYFHDRNTGWIVGREGTILKTTTGGETFLEEINHRKPFTPNQTILFQNYPNPFNSTTTIRFQLPSSGVVTLKLYDILGKEIESLLGGNRLAGEYEIKWQAQGVPSGQYIYRLETGDFFESRKLILQK